MSEKYLSAWLSLVLVVGVVQSEENLGDVDFCGGNKQSPINLKTEDLTTKVYKDLEWSKEYGSTPTKMVATAGGSLTIGTEYRKGAVPRIWSGPLPMPYKLSQFHFHWAQEHGGAEHLVNGHRYLMEMHAVHIKENLTFPQAVEDKDGIAVIAYFFDYSTHDSHAVAHLIEVFRATRASNRTDPVTLPHPFKINELLRPISCNYVTYRGSLTTRPCSENVRWIVSPYLNTISKDQMKEFRSLATRDIVDKDNYRNLQQRNGRRIYYAVRESTIENDHGYPQIEDGEVDDKDSDDEFRVPYDSIHFEDGGDDDGSYVEDERTRY